MSDRLAPNYHHDQIEARNRELRILALSHDALAGDNRRLTSDVATLRAQLALVPAALEQARKTAIANERVKSLRLTAVVWSAFAVLAVAWEGVHHTAELAGNSSLLHPILAVPHPEGVVGLMLLAVVVHGVCELKKVIADKSERPESTDHAQPAAVDEVAPASCDTVISDLSAEGPDESETIH